MKFKENDIFLMILLPASAIFCVVVAAMNISVPEAISEPKVYFECGNHSPSHIATTPEQVQQMTDTHECQRWEVHTVADDKNPRKITLTQLQIDQRQACAELGDVLCERLIDCEAFSSEWACQSALQNDGFCSEIDLNTRPERIRECAAAVKQIDCGDDRTIPSACVDF